MTVIDNCAVYNENTLMAIIELTIPDALFDEWSNYAEAAGLSVEAMLQEATTHSVRNDRLGVENARLQRMLRETRELELLARQGKAISPSGNTSEGRIKASDSTPEKPQTKKEVRTAKPSALDIPPDESLDNARVPESYFDDTDNMANLDIHIPRGI